LPSAVAKYSDSASILRLNVPSAFSLITILVSSAEELSPSKTQTISPE